MALQSAKLLDHPPYQAVYDRVMKPQAEKAKRPEGNPDPPNNPAQETLTTAQIIQLNSHLLTLNQTDADLHHALHMWLLNAIGRSDDGRLVNQSDFFPPKDVKAIGDAHSAFVIMVLVNMAFAAEGPNSVAPVQCCHKLGACNQCNKRNLLVRRIEMTLMVDA